jgi:hypothetical protein
MATMGVAGELTVKGEIMNRSGWAFWVRALRGGAVAALFLLVAGDRGAQTSLIGGIDPLAILKLQVKNNVAIVLDTSGSMKWPVDIDNFPIGGDDPMSRLYQAKTAVNAVVQANSTRLNIGLLTYNVNPLDKSLNANQDFDGGSTNDDGPFVYVSADNPVEPTNAAVFYNTQNCAGAGNVDGFFCQLNDTFGNYDGTGSTETFRSFGNRRGSADYFDDPYPVGCTAGTNCRYYLQSRLFRSNRRFVWNVTNPSDPATTLVSTATISCPLPPVGITPDNPDVDGDGRSDQARPCIEFQDQSGNSSFYYYTSAIFEMQAGNACGGALTIAGVPPCTEPTPAEVLDSMRLELPADDADSLAGGTYTENTVIDYMTGSRFPPLYGVRADQSTPIAGSLSYIHTNSPTPVFQPSQIPGNTPPGCTPGVDCLVQKNFVLVLSDGDDTCASAGNQDGDGDSNDLDDRAIFSARQAQTLYANATDGNTANDVRGAETLFVAFASAINIGRSNKIAQAGSGGIVQGNGTVVCPGGPNPPPCRNAFTASNTQDLIDVLNQALDLISSTGTFSAAPEILSSVFELGPLTDPLLPTDPARVDSMNPDTRYNGRANVLFQSTFDMPGFEGHLYGLFSDPATGAFTPVPSAYGDFDAGETLFQQVSQCLEVANEGHGVNKFTFAELHDGRSIRNIGASACTGTDALIKRRIFTASPVAGGGGSAVNRVYDRDPAVLDEWDGSQDEGSNVVAIWPPNQAGLDSGVADIDPPVSTAGPLDDVLGIGAGSNPVLTLNDLRTRFRACEGSLDSGGPPAACDDTVDPVLALDTARKEARQILLAWVAGAEVVVSPGPVDAGKALRDGTDPLRPLLFKDRGWLLLDTILGAPAIVGPPLRSAPGAHVLEFALFRDGRRDAANQQGIDDLDRGFGLRNPDFDDADPETKPDLKPTMTVVYHPANDMLHAFRAGPNCGPSAGLPFDPLVCTEPGSEELWGFIPYDQLGKIQTLFAGQLIEPHTYTIAGSVRVADIFIPGDFTLQNAGVNVDYEGRWRTVLFLGRGPGGKFYTALDVTSPGPFTRLALDTNPPFVMWNHGNEDPDPISGVDPTSDDAYDGMGQSWSVPAVGNVDVTTDGLPEWRLWVGSGYGDIPSEGTSFYMLNAIDGAVLYAKNVGDGSPTYFPDNALVASPSAFNAFQLDNLTVLARSEDRVSRVYIPDVHGRIWKFDTTSSGGMVADEGPAQPFGVGVALLKLDDVPHIYAAAGADERVPDDAPFRLFGYTDSAGENDTTTDLTQDFFLEFPGKITGVSEGYRGTLQPATAFNAAIPPQPRVFFAGTRFNFTTTDCISSFDTILFAVGGVTGNAVYDFNGDGAVDLYTEIQGTRGTNLQIAGGQVIIGDSGGLGDPPGPPPPPSGNPEPESPEPAQVITREMKPGSPVCRVQ